MNILVTVDDHYVRPLRIMLASLFQHEKQPLDIYLMHSNVSQENLDLLASHIRQLGGERGRFRSVPVQDSMFQGAPITHYFTKEMYYRVLCGELLPKTLDRVLYLDPDMIIRSSIQHFYDMDFSGKTLIGVSDMPTFGGEAYGRKEKCGLSAEDVYVNSGVLLFDMKKMRDEFVLKDFFDHIEQNRDQLEFPDQDMINIFFRGKIGVVSEMYNYSSFYSCMSDFISWILGKKGTIDPVIVHYMGQPKPWEIQYISKYYFEYHRYLKDFQSKRERAFFLLKPCFVVKELWETGCRVLKRVVKKP